MRILIVFFAARLFELSSVALAQPFSLGVMGRSSSHGFAVGAGIEARPWKVRIAPQARYVRWARDGSHVILFTVPDQAQFLVGISF